MAGWRGQKLAGIMHPGSFSLLGVGVSFALSAKAAASDKQVVLISGDGAFLSGGLSIETAFQENLPITVVIDNNGGLIASANSKNACLQTGNTLRRTSATFHFTQCLKVWAATVKWSTQEKSLAQLWTGQWHPANQLALM